MRMTVTKVKPVVVKHILNNQVMSIYDAKVTSADNSETQARAF